jgi:hypothetical protein
LMRGNRTSFTDDPKRAQSWKRRIQPRISLRNDEPVLYSTLNDLFLPKLATGVFGGLSGANDGKISVVPGGGNEPNVYLEW